MDINTLFMVFILVILQLTLDKTIRKKEKFVESIFDTKGYKSYVWILIILSAITAVLIFLFHNNINHLFGMILTVFFGVRCLFEWKYIRRTKRHIISLIMIGASLLISIFMFIFIPFM